MGLFILEVFSDFMLKGSCFVCVCVYTSMCLCMRVRIVGQIICPVVLMLGQSEKEAVT